MQTGLADYGIRVFALSAVAWVLVQVFGTRHKPPDRPADADLMRVIADNTQALTELTVLIRQQSELLRQQAEMLTELRLDAARKEARSA